MTDFRTRWWGMSPFLPLVQHTDGAVGAGGPAAPALHVAMAAAEIAPFAKTGGLGDVMGALPQALERLGVRVTLLMPAYRAVLHGNFPLEDTGIRFTVLVSNRREEGAVLRARVGNNIPVYFIHAEKYFDRDYLCTTPDGDYPDNAERMTFFSRAILEVLKRAPPDILHVHDWHPALSIAFLKTQPYLYRELSAAKTVFTVHNLGYQGLFWHLDWHLLNLDWMFFGLHYLEFWGRINFLKAGAVFADMITTVSTTYAEEIKTKEQGFGLEGVFQERAANLVGILNGVDYDVWDPEKDPHIARNYGLDSLSDKGFCKADIQRSFGLIENPGTPVMGMVTRLTVQKGLDLVEKALENLLSRGIQLIILGTGERAYQELIEELPAEYPGMVGVRIGFDEALAHRIIASSDMLLMPSQYEPGGLTQIYAMKYGTVPIVRVTGGLKDTVQDFDPERGTGVGFTFGPYDATAFLKTVDRALDVFVDKSRWRVLMSNAMAIDYSWERSARAYLDLYRRLAEA